MAGGADRVQDEVVGGERIGRDEVICMKKDGGRPSRNLSSRDSSVVALVERRWLSARFSSRATDSSVSTLIPASSLRQTEDAIVWTNIRMAASTPAQTNDFPHSRSSSIVVGMPMLVCSACSSPACDPETSMMRIS
jgi:hypothetical protein